MRIAAAAAVVIATLAAGIGLGHVAWQGTSTSGSSTPPTSSQTQLPFNFGNGSGGTTTPSSGSGSSSNPNSGSGTGSSASATGIAASVDPGLVDVNTTLGYQGAAAAGTGIVLTSSGEVLTNNHVIDGATSIKVTDIGNGKTYTASVIGYDRTADIAVLQLSDASGLKTASFGDSSKVAVGNSVLAIGNAGGVGGTPSVAAGSITALDQSITASDEGGGNAEQLAGLIEVNASVQPGDSGGPLVNSSGKIIGIDTAASGTAFESQSNAGYAIPINSAATIAAEIVGGQASSTVHIGETAFLGVSVEDASQGGFGSNSSQSGAIVEGVVSGSAAANAGLAQGDVITGLGGTSVTSAESLTLAMEQHHPGDKVQVTWVDTSGAHHSATVQLANGPSS